MLRKIVTVLGLSAALGCDRVQGGDVASFSICRLVGISAYVVEGEITQIHRPTQQGGYAITPVTLKITSTILGTPPNDPVIVTIPGELEATATFSSIGPLDRPGTILFVAEFPEKRFGPYSGGGLFWPDEGQLLNEGYYSSGISRATFDAHVAASSGSAACPANPLQVPGT